MLHYGLVGVDMHTVDTPGLEAVVSACSCADSPQADPPVHTTEVGPAVLGAQWPMGRGREGWTVTMLLREQMHTIPGAMQVLGTANLAYPKSNSLRAPHGSGLHGVKVTPVH